MSHEDFSELLKGGIHDRAPLPNCYPVGSLPYQWTLGNELLCNFRGTSYAHSFLAFFYSETKQNVLSIGFHFLASAGEPPCWRTEHAESFIYQNCNIAIWHHQVLLDSHMPKGLINFCYPISSTIKFDSLWLQHHTSSLLPANYVLPVI